MERLAVACWSSCRWREEIVVRSYRPRNNLVNFIYFFSELARPNPEQSDQLSVFSELARPPVYIHSTQEPVYCLILCILLFFLHSSHSSFTHMSYSILNASLAFVVTTSNYVHREWVMQWQSQTLLEPRRILLCKNIWAILRYPSYFLGDNIWNKYELLIFLVFKLIN